jgi:hypothetical protein
VSSAGEIRGYVGSEKRIVSDKPEVMVRSSLLNDFRMASDPATIPRDTAAKDRIGLRHYCCFVDILPVVLRKKLPTTSANC